MIEDPVVEEVRKARADYAARFGYDLRKMAEDLQKQMEARGIKTVTLPSRKPSSGAERGVRPVG